MYMHRKADFEATGSDMENYRLELLGRVQLLECADSTCTRAVVEERRDEGVSTFQRSTY